ncbi:MAG: twin-arginine translocase subunit TatC [Planctomycetes bacterium]|nr:twin-arginine translocase subunit TatC [Planctomycetota bacterium]
MTAEPLEPRDEHLERMSFGDHLEELRRRLLISLIAVVVAVFGFMPFKQEVTAVYVQPYRIMWNRAFEAHCDRLEQEVADAGGLENVHPVTQEIVKFLRAHKAEALAGTFPAPGQLEIHGNFRMPYALKATGGLEDFWVFMAATILFGLMVAAPIVLYQIWAFLSAGMYEREKRTVRRVFPFALLLLILGVSFGYFVVVPYGLYFLTSMMNWFQVEPMLTVNQYFTLLLMLTAALGFVFQMPLLMLALVKVGIVTHATLKKNWRYIILGFFCVSAMLTPPDPFTQIMMAVPMVFLYLLGLFLTARATRVSGPQPLGEAGA